MKGWRKSAGVVEWKRQTAREAEKKGMKEHVGTLLESDELIIEPSDVTTSKYKREQASVSWARDSIPRMGANDDIQREINDDVDSKLFNEYEAQGGNGIEKSGREMKSAGVAWKKGGDTQGRDVGRISAVDLMKELILSDPQSDGQTLDLEPELTTQSK